MTDNAANGVIRKTGQGYEILFTRRIAKPIEKVWAALTVPERIADWFTEMRFVPELRLGARVEVFFPDDDPPYQMTKGEVVAFAPPRLFAWTWPEDDHPNSVIRCELMPDGDGCMLIFSQSGMGTKYLTGSAAGWHVFLDGLEGAADGIRTPGSIEREKALRPSYEAQLAVVDGRWGADDPEGVFRKTGETCEVVFRRHLRRPLEKVWAALTVPERIGDWLADVTIDGPMRLGARFELTFYSGYRTPCEVVALEPMRLFAWTWGLPEKSGAPVSVVRFELEPAADGCVLTLTNEGLSEPPEDLVSVAGGWHIHLEALPGAADGVRTTPDLEVETRLRAVYRPMVDALR